MKRYALLLYILFLAAAVRAATPRPQPLYIVNGKETSEIRSIPPEDIENVEMLPADEETIARYGQRAAHGVMLITLRYDRPASFPADSAFGSYIARQVRWDESEPTARVVLRYKITPDGETVVQQELESTDNRLKRRVLKAVAEAPRWHPAQKNGAEERRAGRKRRRVEHPASRRPAHAAAGGAGHPLTTPLPKPANLICKSP